MNPKIPSFYAVAALLACCLTVSAQQTGLDDRLATLKALKIDAATSLHVDRAESPSRTIVKLVGR